MTQAARTIGASLEALYRLRHQPGAEQFAAAWEQAIDRGIARLEDCALERAIAGEERVLVRGDMVVARWTRYDTGLLMFLLRQRRSPRWNSEAAQFAALRPGHPVYDRLRRDWAAVEDARSAAEADCAVEEINAKIQKMRDRMIVAGEIEPTDEERARLKLPRPFSA